MASDTVPSKSKALQCSKTAGGLEQHLVWTDRDTPKPKSKQHLVQIIASALNPIDYKLPESALSVFLRWPLVPGIDFVGRIVTPASGSSLRPGELVFGATSFDGSFGSLAEYAVVPANLVAPLPKGVDPLHAAGVNIAGLSAWHALKPYAKPGSRVFLNGGSGGTGVFEIQIAKRLGCHVTVTCSSRNAAFCKDLGADEVITYDTTDIFAALSTLPKFDHVVDNVGHDRSLYWKSGGFTNPHATFVSVAGAITFADLSFIAQALLLPRIASRGRAKFMFFAAKPDAAALAQIAAWMADGSVRVHLDSTYSVEQAPEAFRKLKEGRTRGKIVMKIAAS